MHSHAIGGSVRRLIGATIAVALTLGACTGEETPEVGFDPIDDTSPSASADAEADGEIDVTTTPDEITPEWVTAVVNTLLAEYGEMTAEVLAMPVTDDPTLPDGYEDRLADLFAGDFLRFTESELAALIASQDRRDQLLAPDLFEGLRVEVQLVQLDSSDCIVAVARADRSGTVPDAQDGELTAISLSSSPKTRVPWRLQDLLANTASDGTPNDDAVMLNATLEDYGDALDHTCGDAS